MLPFYPFYWADYSSKTFDLTMEQHGAYMLFLRHIYTTGKPIPAKHCFSIARAMTEQQQKDAMIVLEKFFTFDGENWRNSRCEEVIEEQNIKHQKRVEAGRSGGIAKAVVSNKKNSSNAKAMLKQCSSNQNQNQSILLSSLRSDNNISENLWNGFLDHRKKLKSPMTELAQEIMLKKLKSFKDKGHDPSEILKKSIESGWKGVFGPDCSRDQKSKIIHTNFKKQNYYAGTEGFIVD